MAKPTGFREDTVGTSVKMGSWVVVGLLSSFVVPALGAKDDAAEWKLNVRFVNASNELSESAVQAKVEAWVAEAERQYRRRPALKITYDIVRQTTKGGQNLSRMVFDSSAGYAQFMDRNFDVVAVTRTEGHIPVLITDRLCIGTDKSGAAKCWGGYANFPHWVNPFSRKRGITLVSNKDAPVLAHELGHVFGLKHTFEPYVGFNAACNEDYKPKGKPEGMCNSCANGGIVYDDGGYPDRCSGPTNVMDYCSSTGASEFLNTCQEQRAANQRLSFMTGDGKVNYHRLKGLAGEAICDSDDDCDDGRYCDKGTATVGHNQCLAVKALGTACTRGAQCLSGRCAGLKCALANECEADGDCNTGEYCSKGLASLGRNVCESRLADGRACTGDHQCGSGSCSGWRPQDGQVSGLCYTPSSKSAGQSCRIDLECRTGKCNSAKHCVCRNDGDCSSGYWCDAGADTTPNQCKAKLDKGEVCGTVGELGVGHRCKSGSCKVAGLSKNLECK